MYLTDFFLEAQRDKDSNDKIIIIIFGDFNAQNTLLDKHINQNNKIGLALEELIQKHGLYVATDLDHIYQHSPNCHSSVKSIICLTLSLSRGINNLTVKTREINNIKTRHKAIGIDIENLSDKGRSHTPYFRTQDANWDEWCKLLDNNLLQFISSFCNKVSRNILMTNLTYF